MNVLTPIEGIDPRAPLASSMYASPGVYAVLVGSGMSSAAGVLTGWQIVEDLANRVALLERVDIDARAETPVEWFTETYGHEPTYDELLGVLAPTDRDRRALLRQYFDPSTDPDAPRQPTSAHKALARLCASGRIKVIVTTNFDRLLERALEDAGVRSQVIVTTDDRDGMTPLAHADATVVKLHGDYLATMRNTTEELAAYPDDLRKLLDQIFDEYGLLVAGWSAEYDTALVSAISACASRRYPTYWLRYRGQITEAATRLIGNRQATIIETSGADEFFLDIEERIARLDYRARRRARPAAMWHYDFPPEQSTPPQGWAALPLLQLRTVAVMAPAPLEECSPITPLERRRLLEMLAPAAITGAISRIRSFAVPVSAVVIDEESGPKDYTQDALGPWMPTPDGYQSDREASYRLGGDATVGVSALLNVRLPNVGMQGGRITFILDIGVSISAPLMLGQVARLWRDSLVATTSLIPDALTAVLPPDADIAQVEIHALAATSDGQQHSRENSLSDRVAHQSIGYPSRPLAASVGAAMAIHGSLTEHDAAEVTVDAVERIALAHGFLEPTIGIRSLRAELGLPVSA